jgi:hypothetical protein
MQLCSGWESVAGLKFVHTATAKNSADMLLAIDAVDLACKHQIDTFVIVSSDGDFSHLAHYLREAGHEVVGFGEAKTPVAFRTACSEFVQVGSVPRPVAVEKPAPVQKPKIPARDNDINQKAKSVIRANGTNNCMPLTAFNGQMLKRHDIKIGEHEKIHWRNYLDQYPDIFELDPRGPSACVRLKQ